MKEQPRLFNQKTLLLLFAVGIFLMVISSIVSAQPKIFERPPGIGENVLVIPNPIGVAKGAPKDVFQPPPNGISAQVAPAITGTQKVDIRPVFTPPPSPTPVVVQMPPFIPLPPVQSFGGQWGRYAP